MFVIFISSVVVC